MADIPPTDPNTPAANGGTQSPPPAANPPDAAPPAGGVDVAALVQAELAKVRAADAEAFQAATGYASLEDMKAAQLKEQGKTAELLALREQELAAVTAAHRESAVSAAILAAASEAIDPAVVQSLLAAQAAFDAKTGAVAINGKSPKDAVAALLKDKPFLAKPAGPAGSGAPQSAGAGGRPNPWAKDGFNLTEQGRLMTENPAEAARLRAAAGL